MQKNWRAEDRYRLLLCLVIFGLMAALIVLPTQFSSSADGKKVKKGLFRTSKSHEEGLENYDIRSDEKNEKVAEFFAKNRQTAGRDAVAVADLRSAFVQGEEQFKSQFPTAKIEYNSDIRTPEVITPDVYRSKIEWLSAPSAAKRSEILRNFVKQNNLLIGVSDAQADSLKVTADYTNPNGYLSFAHLEQRINNIPVFRGEVKAGFNKNGQIIRVINNLAPGLDYESVSTEFHDPVDALKAAFRHINKEAAEAQLAVNQAASDDLKTVFGQGDFANTAEKMYFPTEPGVAVPAWRVLIWQPVNAYYVIVDAASGAMLWRKNLTEDQTLPATYNVYANPNGYINVADSPFPLSPGPISPLLGTQGAAINRTLITRVGNEAPYTFNNLGWITDGNNTTDGNNVQAGLDRKLPNTQIPQVDPADIDPDGMAVGSPNRVFDFPFTPGNPNTNSGDSPLPAGQTPGTCLAASNTSLPTNYQKAAVTQLFYVVNRYHDELYRLGFTEQAFNFQHDNFGRGGVGGDRVSAQAQDCSDTDNANFTTPADGTRGSMQMYIWTGPSPDFDGDLDAEVIIHEHTHGLSNRLHGNSSGLTTNMARGMGEGWGDFYGYTLLAEPTDPIDGIYTTGGYATYLADTGYTGNYYYGIRRFPRAPITFLGPNGKPHNPFTFKWINTGCATLIGNGTTAPNSAFPRSIFGSSTCDQVHNAGEVWSSALWEIRNRMVARLGFNAGTTRVLQVVTDGMKMAPLAPTFLSERDAIIAAAAAFPVAPEASADVNDVREGFRVRGIGFSASIQTTSPAAVTEAFDVPNALIANPISMSDATSGGDGDGYAEPGENILISVPITNSSGSGEINNVVGSITGGGSVNYGSIADGATATRQIPYTVPADAACGSQHTVTITGTSDLGPLNPRTFTFRLGEPVGGAPVTFESNTLMNLPNGQPATTSGAAGPYSSDIVVSGLSGNKTIKVELTGNNHSWAGDLDVLLEGPGGQKFVIMSDAFEISNRAPANVSTTMTIRDGATANMPASSQWTATADFKPTNHGAGDAFPAPAPATAHSNPAPAGSATFESVFGTNGASMNGTWKLWVVDDTSQDSGSMQEWKITFEANDFLCQITPPNTGAESRADFDGDGRTDISVFRPSNGVWYLNQTSVGFGALVWGISTDVPTPGDFDGDGKTDFAVFRANPDGSQPDFYVLNSNGFTFSGASWGLPGDIPVIRDYDGDDKEDIAVFRPANNVWYILKSGGGITVTAFGQNGDVPVAGDFDGDGKGDLTVYRNGTWISQGSAGGAFSTSFGQLGDVLVPGDYGGGDADDLAVYRPSTGQWIYRPSGGAADVTVLWGVATDIPVPGDYDGDGKDDPAIYREGIWWVLRSTAGSMTIPFGLPTDKALPRSYIP
ncbi:MAG TPA: M36 family metallopeptidase [Pyrinomonadaceae bacterium]|jgi:subtilisin-like proprotein convertase family protein